MVRKMKENFKILNNKMNRKEYINKYYHDLKTNICPVTKKYFKYAFTDHNRTFIEDGEEKILSFNSCCHCNSKYKNKRPVDLLNELLNR